MKSVLIATSMTVFLMSSCASSRVNWREQGYGSDRAAAARASKGDRDEVRTNKSSYRVRGTDEVGSLTPRQHAALRAKTHHWRWPVNQVELTSRFGYRNGEFHDGVDLRAGIGTPIYAVSDGTVLYSGSKIRGYGRMVVLRHAGKLSSVYAHNSKLHVRQGQRVRRGQLIAHSGNTGRSTGPHLHFEVREGVTAINPSILLQSPNVHNNTYHRVAMKPLKPDPRVAAVEEEDRDNVKTRASSRRPAARRAPASRSPTRVVQKRSKKRVSQRKSAHQVQRKAPTKSAAKRRDAESQAI